MMRKLTLADDFRAYSSKHTSGGICEAIEGTVGKNLPLVNVIIKWRLACNKTPMSDAHSDS